MCWTRESEIPRQGGAGRGLCGQGPLPPSSGPLDAAARAALFAALVDERRAQATYLAILRRFGPIAPFDHIVMAEARHASAVERVLHAHGESAPVDGFLADPLPPPATLTEAFAQAIAAEIENIQLYDAVLLPAVTGHADIEQLFHFLRDASRDRHLPAFRHHAARLAEAAEQSAAPPPA